MQTTKTNNIIVCDTREKQNKKILEYFDSVGQDYIISKLDVGDYMFYKDYSVVIDRKDSLLELARNLCNREEHERIKREIIKSKKYGFEKFVFLISESKIKSEDNIKNWSSVHTKVKGETLLKIMKTMSSKYNIKFMITSREKIGEKIIKILEER